MSAKSLASELRKRLEKRCLIKRNEQQEFQKQTGINIETDIDHIVAYTEQSVSTGNPTPGMVLARGTFAESKIEALMRGARARVEPYKRQAPHHQVRATVSCRRTPATMPARRSWWLGQTSRSRFSRRDSMAVGNAELVRRAVDFGTGGDNLTANDEMMNLIKSLEPGNAWAVGWFGLAPRRREPA